MSKRRKHIGFEWLDTRFGIVKVGDKIKITKLEDPFDDSYPGRTGIVQFIDDMGHMHGTWGGLAVVPDSDEFIVL